MVNNLYALLIYNYISSIIFSEVSYIYDVDLLIWQLIHNAFIYAIFYKMFLTQKIKKLWLQVYITIDFLLAFIDAGITANTTYSIIIGHIYEIITMLSIVSLVVINSRYFYSKKEYTIKGYIILKKPSNYVSMLIAFFGYIFGGFSGASYMIEGVCYGYKRNRDSNGKKSKIGIFQKMENFPNNDNYVYISTRFSEEEKQNLENKVGKKWSLINNCKRVLSC